MSRAGIMSKREPPTSSTSNIPKDSPETLMTLERALNLLGIEGAPGGKDQEAFIVRGMTKLVARHGEEWIKQNRRRLVDELYYLADI